jgi:hypothetical protein
VLALSPAAGPVSSHTFRCIAGLARLGRYENVGDVSSCACLKSNQRSSERELEVGGGWRNRELACRLSSGTPAVSNPTHIPPDHKDYLAEDTTIELATPQATRKFCSGRNRKAVETSKGMTDAWHGKFFEKNEHG